MYGIGGRNDYNRLCCVITTILIRISFHLNQDTPTIYGTHNFSYLDCFCFCFTSLQTYLIYCLLDMEAQWLCFLFIPLILKLPNPRFLSFKSTFYFRILPIFFIPRQTHWPSESNRISSGSGERAPLARFLH